MAYDLWLSSLLTALQYTVAAIGFAILLSVLRIANLAYGQVLAAAGFGAALTATQTNNRIVIGIAAVLASAVLGQIVYTIAIRPLGAVSNVQAPAHTAVLLSTLGVSLIAQNAASYLFGYGLRVPRMLYIAQENQLASRSVLLDVTISAAFLVALHLFIAHSKFGLQLRALTDNAELGTIIGINIRRQQSLAVLLSSVAAGFAGLMIFQRLQEIKPLSGEFYGLKAVVLTVVAGPLSSARLLAVGFVLATVETFSAAYLSSSYRDVFGLGTLLLLLLIRGAAPTLRRHYAR